MVLDGTGGDSQAFLQKATASMGIPPDPLVAVPAAGALQLPLVAPAQQMQGMMASPMWPSGEPLPDAHGVPDMSKKALPYSHAHLAVAPKYMSPSNSLVQDVSTEWHVHLVREAEVLNQSRGDVLGGKCQLCVQCPNGRKHSSLFAVHLLPHWLGVVDPDRPAQDRPVTCSNIKACPAASDSWQAQDMTQRIRLQATLSDWLTGEEYEDAIVFSTHPNGHLFGDKQTPVLTMPIYSDMKALMKIRRPLDPRQPGEQMPLSRLSTLKITLHVEFTRGMVTWHKDFVSPGVVKLVSRVQDRAQEDIDFRKRKEAPPRHDEVAAASILAAGCSPDNHLAQHLTGLQALPQPPSMPGMPLALSVPNQQLAHMTPAHALMSMGPQHMSPRQLSHASLMMQQSRAASSAAASAAAASAAAVAVAAVQPLQAAPQFQQHMRMIASSQIPGAAQIPPPGLTVLPVPQLPVPQQAPPPLAVQPQVEAPPQSSPADLRAEAQKHMDTFVRAYAHNPMVVVQVLEKVIAETPKFDWPQQPATEPMPVMPGAAQSVKMPRTSAPSGYPGVAMESAIDIEAPALMPADIALGPASVTDIGNPHDAVDAAAVEATATAVEEAEAAAQRKEVLDAQYLGAEGNCFVCES